MKIDNRVPLAIVALVALTLVCRDGQGVAQAQAQAPAEAAPQAPPQAPPKTSPASAAPVAPTPRPAAPAAPTSPVDSYRIGPEDVLDISVWKNPDLTRTAVAVRPDGKISLPLLNDVQAADLTPLQLRDALAHGYQEYLKGSDAEVSVIVHEIHSIKVSVVGKVKNPNRFELRSHATVLEALALAGGLADFAKPDRIVVFRRKGSGWDRLPFNYTHVVNDWDEKQNFPLEPGDIVIVP